MPDEPCHGTMVADILYTNVLSTTTRKHVMGKSHPKGVNEQGQPEMVSARDDLEFMKLAAEEMKTHEKKEGEGEGEEGEGEG